MMSCTLFIVGKNARRAAWAFLAKLQAAERLTSKYGLAAAVALFLRFHNWPHRTSRLTVGSVGADSDGLNLRPPSSFQRPLYVYGLQARLYSLAASCLVGILSCGASTTQSLFQSVGFVVCDRR